MKRFIYSIYGYALSFLVCDCFLFVCTSVAVIVYFVCAYRIRARIYLLLNVVLFFFFFFFFFAERQTCRIVFHFVVVVVVVRGENCTHAHSIHTIRYRWINRIMTFSVFQLFMVNKF